MAKKKKKRRLKIKNITICLIILFIFVYGIYYILTLPINNIYINGNKILKENEILSLAELDTYPSFLLTSLKKISIKLKKNNYIKEVKARKELGNKVYIEIEEYSPICILNNEKILLSSGVELTNEYSITDVPYLTDNLEKKELKKAFIEKFSKIDKNVLRQVSQITYKPINVDEERFLLYMDDGNQVYITLTKIDKLNKYNEIVERMDGSHGIIYLDSGDYIEVKDLTEVIDTSNNSMNIETNNQVATPSQ